MRRAARWAGALSAAAAAAAVVSGCGAGADAVSVPAAPGAALTDRVLSTEDLGIPGFTASREPLVAQDADGLEAGACAAEREASLKVLGSVGFQAGVRRPFTADNGGGLSAVWQFATPAGATRWNRAVLDQIPRPLKGCVPSGVTQTSYSTSRLAGLPNGVLTHATENTPDGRTEAWNILFTDGRFAYVVGTAAPPGTVSSAQLKAAAQRQWERRDG